MATKTVSMTYLCWLLGGWFGLHHLYLRRDRQCFVWFATCGGFLGIGWFRDIWRIPEYVNDVNEESGFMKNLIRKMNNNSRPSIGFFKSSGMFFFSFWVGIIFRACIPEEYIADGYPWKLIDVFLPLVIATAVWFVGGIGRHKVTFWWSVLGAYIPFYWYYNNANNISTVALASSSLVGYKGTQWKRTGTRHRGMCKRLSLLSAGALLYYSMFASMLLFNAHVTTKDGEKVPLRTAARNFFTSPAWQQTKQTLSEIWTYYRLHGIGRVWQEILTAFDPQGEENAYKVLGLSSSASQEEIKIAYKKLARTWHPDRFKDATEKESAQAAFMEISESYQILSKVKNRRMRANKNSREEDKKNDEL